MAHEAYTSEEIEAFKMGGFDTVPAQQQRHRWLATLAAAEARAEEAEKCVAQLAVACAEDHTRTRALLGAARVYVQHGVSTTNPLDCVAHDLCARLDAELEP